MTVQKFIQWSTTALVLSGLFEILASFQNLAHWMLSISAVAGWVLLIIGFAGLHARQVHKTGWFGYVGLGLLFIGTALSLLPYVVGSNLLSNSLFLSTNGKRIAFLLFETSLVAQVGYFLYGLSSLRVRVLPQVINYLLIISVILMIISGIFGQGLSTAAIGILLRRNDALAQAA
ncbi:MAG: hypothetical protein P4L50_04500 [Anaerolineaceae bacterium]|nr:hypothetical protein [Anaerolineaceae bacterium]